MKFRIRTLFIFCVILFLFSCKNKSDQVNLSDQVQPVPLTPDELRTEIKTYQQDDGWGYDIYVNDAKYIHQPTIPAINGLKTFKTEEQAKKVAELVEQKIKGNVIPPTVTIEEMQLMGIDLGEEENN